MKHLEKEIMEDAGKKLALIAEAKAWPTLMASLKKRTPAVNETEFCRRYGINLARFNRVKNGSEKSLPSEKFFSQVRNAFKAEGL